VADCSSALDRQRVVSCICIKIPCNEEGYPNKEEGYSGKEVGLGRGFRGPVIWYINTKFEVSSFGRTGPEIRGLSRTETQTSPVDRSLPLSPFFLHFCLLILLYIMFAVFRATATMIWWNKDTYTDGRKHKNSFLLYYTQATNAKAGGFFLLRLRVATWSAQLDACYSERRHCWAVIRPTGYVNVA